MKDPSFGLKIWKYIHRQYLMDSYQKKKNPDIYQLDFIKISGIIAIYMYLFCLFVFFSVKNVVKERTIF